MTCDDFQARYLAGDRTPASDSHLAGCSACRFERPGLDRLRAALSDPMTWELPAPVLEQRVVDAVRIQRAPGPLRRWSRRGVAFTGVAAIAVLVVAFVLGSMLRRPDWSTQLIATAEAPTATATVDGWITDEGTRMRFDVSGLAPSGPNAYYEIWLTAPDGTHVSAGSFHTAGVVETSIGVARRDYPRVWITLESIDNDLGPSTVTVLDDPDA